MYVTFNQNNPHLGIRIISKTVINFRIYLSKNHSVEIRSQHYEKSIFPTGSQILIFKLMRQAELFKIQIGMTQVLRINKTLLLSFSDARIWETIS